MDHVNQQPVRIQNPILPGFHPDPSVVRVGDTYYLAVSTFQWFPGVAVYQSRDLAHWSFAAFPLTRESQLPLRGVPDSCGIFAPCLSWDGGTFYLVYTVVKTDSVWQDTDNYLVTAPDITGPWSEPVYLNSAGFDPSLFHDADGRKWLVNRDCDTRGYLQDRGGILLREYDPAARRLTGPEYRIYRSTKIIGAEGPHLYRKDGWYYLLLAEGGTDWNHVATLARSESLFGPYTCAPNTPFLTSRDAPELPLQKAGHGCLVETPEGRWYLTHLVGRPLPGTRRCVLGRETALQEVRWTEDGWLELAHGGHWPAVEVAVPAVEAEPVPRSCLDHFDRTELGYPYQTLRVPLPETVLSLTQRPGWLRLYGRDSLHSLDQQSLVARRQQAFSYDAETKMEYHPGNYHQMAGLICLYDTSNFYYLYVTRDEGGRRRLNLLVSLGHVLSWPLEDGVALETEDALVLHAQVRRDRLQFFWRPEAENELRPIGPVLDYSVLSDDWYMERGSYRFTGAFVGLCCQDCGDRMSWADFDYFLYEEQEEHYDGC